MDKQKERRNAVSNSDAATVWQDEYKEEEEDQTMVLFDIITSIHQSQPSY